MPTPVEQQMIVGLQQRLVAALGGFDKLNTYAADAVPARRYEPPDGWAMSQALVGLVDVLVAKGLITEEEFSVAGLRRQCDRIETDLREAAEDFRQATGLMVPLGFSMRPQG